MDGVLVIDKPAGMTSHDVVAHVRRITAERSVGHLGTLDPMATGVLPLVLGRFTRLAQFYNNSEKAYEGTIRLGVATDTYDAEGEPISSLNPFLGTLEDLRNAAANLAGNIEQLPPPFSAKKIAGVPAYKLARKKREFELKPVQVQVRKFEIVDLHADRARFRADVSAGTYIRSLAHDMGSELGIGAHLSELRRIQSAEFNIREGVTLAKLEAIFRGSDQILHNTHYRTLHLWAEAPFVHPRRILPAFPAVTITDEQASLISNGRAVNLAEFSGAALVKVFWGRDRLVAIAKRVAGTLFHPQVVLISGAADLQKQGQPVSPTSTRH
jgi:tRNA pseudouridine55 synthase